jgi:hypothetical protein
MSLDADPCAVDHDRDKDSLHILPLSMIPLATGALRQTRLIKNSRLEGVVEIFNNTSTGSGQVSPDDLADVFDLSGDRKKDLDIVKALSILPSYDVYSLRVSLRNLGIDVESQENLKLSAEKSRELAEYMRVFTRPLMVAVYGSQKSEDASLADIVQLFASPDVETARQNLRNLSKTLNLDIMQIPKFLQDYADVYLSLAYYQYCLELNIPSLSAFLKSIAELKKDPTLGSDKSFLATCKAIEDRLRHIHTEARNILKMFQNQTEDMWQNLSDERFRVMEEMIEKYQSGIGGALCAVTVKMNAWDSAFPTPSAGRPSKRADFIVRNMQQGLDCIEDLGCVDV